MKNNDKHPWVPQSTSSWGAFHYMYKGNKILDHNTKKHVKCCCRTEFLNKNKFFSLKAFSQVSAYPIPPHCTCLLASFLIPFPLGWRKPKAQSFLAPGFKGASWHLWSTRTKNWRSQRQTNKWNTILNAASVKINFKKTGKNQNGIFLSRLFMHHLPGQHSV